MKIEIREGRQEQEKKLRVCAYCRVSTDADEQENSLENQIQQATALSGQANQQLQAHVALRPEGLEASRIPVHAC